MVRWIQKTMKHNDNFKSIDQIDFNPSRNLGYSIYFHSTESANLCENCVQYEDHDDDVLFLELPNWEDFTLRCDLCHDRIKCDYPPSSSKEAIDRLVQQFGWCEDSAKSYVNNFKGSE